MILNRIKKIFNFIFFKTINLLKCYGINLGLTKKALTNTFRFVDEYLSYKKQLKTSSNVSRNSFKPRKRDITPYLFDYDTEAGSLGSYFHQDLWAARKIYEYRPNKHYDFGSRIDGFIAHLLVFMDVSVVDIREINSTVKGLNFIKSDATNLDSFSESSIESISSLHAVEHFGLGRYGDPINPDGCFEFMQNLQDILSVGGKLIFSVPVGKEAIIFNAQRIFSPKTIIESFNKLSLVSYSAITRNKELIENTKHKKYLEDNHAVGLFVFTKE